MVTQGMIRQARDDRGVSVRQLASALGVSPSAVVGWEKAEERGVIQIGTLQRALRALEQDLLLSSKPSNPSPRRQTREERVSLELHRGVVAKLMVDPDAVLSVVATNVQKMRPHVRGAAPAQWLDRWESLAAKRDVPGLVQVMLDPSQEGVDMRQCTPFAGALTQQERLEAIAKAQRDGN